MMTPVDLDIHLERLGVSQTEAAQLLGVASRTVRRWFEGEEIPGPAEQALRAWIRLQERSLIWRPDTVSLQQNDQQQIAALREHSIELSDALARVEARGGPRFPWLVDREHCRAILGPMEVRFYKLANGGFSLASYTHKNTIPDVQRDRELIEDAAFYIAKEMKKEAAIPVTLVYMVGSNFVGPDGRFGAMRHEECSSNEDAIRRAAALIESPNVHSLAIREGTFNSSGEFLWNDVDIRRECARRPKPQGNS
jgi:transposase-like protein